MFRGVVVLRHAFKIAGFQDVLVSGLKIGKVPGDALLELGDRCIRSGGRLDATFVQLTVVFSEALRINKLVSGHPEQP
jgi:hypothetical protein